MIVYLYYKTTGRPVPYTFGLGMMAAGIDSLAAVALLGLYLLAR